MGKPRFLLINECSRCEGQASRIEITPDLFLKYAGPGGWNGDVGDKIPEEDAAAIIEIFADPIEPERLKSRFYDMAGFCSVCMAFYCESCWNSSATGFGKCPEGHGKSLDPHWSPNSD